MILNSTRPWIWTEISYFRLQLEFSSRRFLHTRYGFVSKYELTLSLETGAFKYVSRARYFFVMQISLSVLVFFLRVITWNVLATAVFQLEMFLKRKKTVSSIVELEEDVCLYEEWGNGWVGRFRVFQLPGTVEGGGTLFWAAAFPRIDSAFCAAKNSFFKSMRWSNCNSTFLLAQAAGTKYKISGNFIIFEFDLARSTTKQTAIRIAVNFICVIYERFLMHFRVSTWGAATFRFKNKEAENKGAFGKITDILI